MKKFMLLTMVFLVLIFSSCAAENGRDAGDEGRSFEATVVSADENNLYVRPSEGTAEIKSSDRIDIGTRKITEESSLEYLKEAAPGDIIEISYTGGIAESYPAAIDGAYSVKLVQKAELQDKIPMLMVSGKLYFSTGNESSVTSHSGAMDGEISSSVPGTETPTENDQSNFGSGYGYRYGVNDCIEVFMDEKWMVFEYRGDGSGDKIEFEGQCYDPASLSEDTVEWIAWYNSLTEDEQLAVDFIPAELTGQNGDSAMNTTDAEG